MYPNVNGHHTHPPVGEHVYVSTASPTRPVMSYLSAASPNYHHAIIPNTDTLTNTGNTDAGNLSSPSNMGKETPQRRSYRSAAMGNTPTTHGVQGDAIQISTINTPSGGVSKESTAAPDDDSICV